MSEASQRSRRKSLRQAQPAHELPAAVRVAWVAFVTQTIAHLPFVAEDEVLTVIWWVNRHTMLEAR